MSGEYGIGSKEWASRRFSRGVLSISLASSGGLKELLVLETDLKKKADQVAMRLRVIWLDRALSIVAPSAFVNWIV